ncbi:DUF3311 domain-containing protein [Halobacterium litoreum]|uniref:DUF3311 domain-containing protein n=1 Tax=Halobacterium litoreum TaxID=2039234 RepID=A0ABD5NDU5_9EURY|nr:DUF3311 domain-containing protein [Halobacterium litoreum]UHH13893.1 DUF3311 domain-containing protein [Halobacterium litoreum]
MPSREAVGWGVVFAALVAFSIPWFLWRNDTLVAGLPLWLWWHVGWMVAASLAFAAFARRDWGTFVEGSA